MTRLLAAILLLPFVGQAQLIKLDALEHLSSKASDTVRFNLDGQLLQLAAKFLDSDSDDIDAAEVKKIVAGLRSLDVRSFKFKNSGEYLESDIEPLRSQLRDPVWKRVLQTHSKTEGDADVYVKSAANKVDGLVVVSAEPKQLTVVVLEGAVDVDGLAKLAGNFGIPKQVRRNIEERSDKEKLK